MRTASGRGEIPTRDAIRPGAMAALGLVALLGACATNTSPPMTATQEAATYKARAKPSYTPPGPPDDPWRPYIEEASKRFDVPERWVREVMRVESGGRQFNASGVLVTSPVGAMGLMQLMPETYDEVRARYSLTDDAFDPHNNILAGTAYLREMYDAFGSPGMLAAYNGGPARLEDYLVHNRPLPAETRRYVAMIAPYIRGTWPEARSPAEQYAVNQLPDEIPAGPRYPRHILLAAHVARHGHSVGVRYASATVRRGHLHAQPVEVAEAPERPAHATIRLASTGFTVHHGVHLIEPVHVIDTATHGSGAHEWGRGPVVRTAVAHGAATHVRLQTSYMHVAASHACHASHGKACTARS